MAVKNPDQFLKQLSEALEETRRYLRERSQGQPGPGTVEQLDILLKYLETIGRNVRDKRIPPVEKRHRESMGWILIDGWDPKDPLGKRILDLNHYYLDRLA